MQPHGINLDGVFGIMPNNHWTNFGPVADGDLPRLRFGLAAEGKILMVNSRDRLPRMSDYAPIPTAVRVADADRVRLGAYLADGTTVMHEGFVNFNAGTLGASMVEGRISAGVLVGHGTDVGGGASIMGTLSGGGKEVISIGERCLLGANSGLGISLGDDCVVEAGLYLTARAKVLVKGLMQMGEFRKPVVVKAVKFSGKNGFLFRRDSMTGAVEALAREGHGVELNSILHAN